MIKKALSLFVFLVLMSHLSIYLYENFSNDKKENIISIDKKENNISELSKSKFDKFIENEITKFGINIQEVSPFQLYILKSLPIFLMVLLFSINVICIIYKIASREESVGPIFVVVSLFLNIIVTYFAYKIFLSLFIFML